MAKVGRWVNDPHVGTYCSIRFDDGEEIIVGHDRRNWLTVERLKLFGFSSDPLFECRLDSDEGQTILAVLMRHVEPGRALMPLAAFTTYLAACESVDAVRAACRALLTMDHRA